MAQVPLTFNNYVSSGPSGPHERRPVRTPGGPGGLILIEQKSGGTLQRRRFQIGCTVAGHSDLSRGDAQLLVCECVRGSRVAARSRSTI